MIGTPQEDTRAPQPGGCQPASVRVLWSRQDRHRPLLIACCCGLGALAAAITVFDLATFIWAAEPTTKLSDPPKTSKLLFVLLMLVAAASALSWVAWRIQSVGSAHHAVTSQWTITSTVLWSLLGFSVFFICYPLPYHSHHIDKMLLAVVLVLLWSLVLALRPAAIGAFVRSHVYRWIRIGLVNALVFVCVGEAVLRLVDPVLARNGLFGNKHSPADMRPHMPTLGSIGVTNSQGFRDRERSFERRLDTPRVVALGDSFAYGAGVNYDDIFLTLIERSLQKRAAGSEIINLGVSGWDPPEEFHLLKVYGSQFEPDLVMMSLFIGNDIMRRRGAYLEEPRVVAGQSYYVHVVGNWVHDTFGPDRWFLYHNVNFLLKVGSRRLWRASEENPASVEPAGASVALRTRPEYLRDIDERSDIYLKAETPEVGYHWRRTVATLNAMRQYLDARNIPFLLVLLPAHEQIDGGVRREWMAAVGTDSDRYVFDKPQRLLNDWCRQRGVAVVDLLPVFERESDSSRLFFRNDIHWTTAAHALAAKHILPTLERSLRAARSHGDD